MKNHLKLWTQLILAALAAGILVGSATLPLVFTDALVENFLKILELVARLS